jgi:hypothetical protein
VEEEGGGVGAAVPWRRWAARAQGPAAHHADGIGQHIVGVVLRVGVDGVGGVRARDAAAGEVRHGLRADRAAEDRNRRRREVERRPVGSDRGDALASLDDDLERGHAHHRGEDDDAERLEPRLRAARAVGAGGAGGAAAGGRAGGRVDGRAGGRAGGRRAPCPRGT